MSNLRGTEGLTSFNKTWAPYSGAPKTFPYQLAVVINGELERAMIYATHLDSCGRFEALSDLDDYCTCGLADLKAYVRRLAPHKYDGHGDLKPEYLPS